jgi:hypothetical protein
MAWLSGFMVPVAIGFKISRCIICIKGQDVDLTLAVSQTASPLVAGKHYPENEPHITHELSILANLPIPATKTTPRSNV